MLAVSRHCRNGSISWPMTGGMLLGLPGRADLVSVLPKKRKRKRRQHHHEKHPGKSHAGQYRRPAAQTRTGPADAGIVRMQHSRAITRKSASNLALAFVLLPRPKRDAMSALYAFCRAVDDVADDESVPVKNGAIQLAAWRDDIRRDRRKPAATIRHQPGISTHHPASFICPTRFSTN